MTTLLIDGDLLAYSSTSAAEVEVNWHGDLWTLHTDLAKAKESFSQKVEEGLKLTDCDRAIIALTSPDNFRLRVLPTYKGNRKTRKPTGYPALIEWVKESFTTYQRPTLEADDILGILATHPKLVPGDRILWSADKDLKSIPGTLWRGELGPDGTPVLVRVSEEDADLHHLTQTLTGDQTDGYSGCPGIGPAKAAKILESASNKWRAVVDAYTKAGLSEAEALVQARVARICRHTDYDFKKKEVILWNP